MINTILVFTEDFKIFKTNTADIKHVANFKGWYCDLGKNLLCLSQHYDKISLSECGNAGTTCNKPLCWCGADLEIPKAITKDILDTFISKFLQLLGYEFPEWNKTDKIIAAGANTFLANREFNIDWTTMKKCNYDCSYCPPGTHDNFSPSPSFLDCKTYFENAIEKYSINLKQYSKVRVTLTGGEPTLMRDFSDLIDWIKDFGEPNIVTNFTAPTEDLINWHQYSRYNISMHPEYITRKKIDKLIDFLNTTPYRNFITIKYFNDCDKIDEIKNFLENNKQFHSWVKVRSYPIIDKTGPYRILSIKGIN
jgi:organic radical activating enzyme